MNQMKSNFTDEIKFILEQLIEWVRSHQIT